MMKMKRESIQSLEFKKMSFHYPGQGIVFDKVNFKFPENNFLLLQGPTGGGKNTLLKIMAGLVPITNGEYLINGQNMEQLSHSEFDRYRLSIGYAFDNGGLINNLTLYENFKLILDFHTEYSPEEKKSKILEGLSLLNLDEVKHLRPAMVSSGSRKAALLIRSLFLDPEMLILNNPTLGLNIEHLDTFVKMIQHHRKEKNLKHIIVASDDMNFISKFETTNIKVIDKKIQLEEKNKLPKAA
jgi:phospholipid/cholesterol/gamma-HCH transport system ATP-binding protein